MAIKVGQHVRIKHGQGQVPDDLVGQVGVVKRIEHHVYWVIYNGQQYFLYHDELEEILPPSTLPPDTGWCDSCRDTTTTKKSTMDCKHEVYMCCGCNEYPRALGYCAACKQKKSPWVYDKFDWFDEDLNYY